jgi:perosamine synthetase
MTGQPVAAREERKIPWWLPQIGRKEYELVRGVLDSNYLNDGDVTEEFERRVAELLGVRHAVAVTSGTAALSMALAGVGVGPGHEVIVPDVTFIATANAVSMIGARPVLVDVDPATLNIDPARVEQAIGPATRAVVPVHVSGRGADMPRLVALAARHGLAVVEDAAEAFLSRAHGGWLGTHGKAGCFSFSPNKTITTGQGGMIVTDDAALHGRLRELKDQGRPVRGTGGDDLHHSVGYNFKLTNLQAAVGLAQLAYLEARLARLKQIYRGYAAGLAGVDGLTLPGFDVDSGESPQWVDALVERRDDLDAHLASRNAHCRRFWFPIHTQAPYRGGDDRFPVSTRVMPRALWLPSAFTLTDADVGRVCAHVREFLSTNRSGRS